MIRSLPLSVLTRTLKRLATLGRPLRELEPGSRIRLLRRRLENGRRLRFGLVLFGFIWGKIFLINVNDLNFRAELTIAAEKNLIACLLSLSTHPAGQLDHCARSQKVRLLVIRVQIVFVRLVWGIILYIWINF